MRAIRLIVAMLTLLAMVFSSGCSSYDLYSIKSVDLMSGFTPSNAPTKSGLGTEKGFADFCTRLFVENVNCDGDVLVSPLSVYFALGMTANGAKNGTLAEMESVLGMPISSINEYLNSYGKSLDKSDILSIANAVWFKTDDDFTVSREFLQKNADFYRAGAYEAPFDETTLKDINNFVEKNTHGMIEEVLDRIEKDTVMYLVNALAFEGEWEKKYKSEQITDGVFHAKSGEKQATMMHSTENVYFETEDAFGGAKYYDGGRYAFVGILPKEGDVQAYAKALDGEKLNALLNARQYGFEVNLTVPRFESEFSADLVSVLADMGMPSAFDSDIADLTGLGEVTEGYRLAISKVIHKTFVSVDENGTRAGAATVVGVIKATSVGPDEVKYVTLDRPFMYMIMDMQENVPLFLGIYTGE